MRHMLSGDYGNKTHSSCNPLIVNVLNTELAMFLPAPISYQKCFGDWKIAQAVGSQQRTGFLG